MKQQIRGKIGASGYPLGIGPGLGHLAVLRAAKKPHGIVQSQRSKNIALNAKLKLIENERMKNKLR